MWNPLYKSLADQGEEVDATRRRQLDLANYRGPGWAEMANDANGQFWNYAGKTAPATAAAAAQMYTDPSVASLRNRGAVDVAGLEQGGASARATEGAMTALKEARMKEQGLGQRSDTAANTALGVAGIGADAARATTDAEVKGRANVAGIQGEYGLKGTQADVNARVAADERQAKEEMARLLLQLKGARENTLSNNQTDLSVAGMRGLGGNFAPSAPAGAGQPPPAGLVAPREGEWRRMETGEMAQWLNGDWVESPIPQPKRTGR